MGSVRYSDARGLNILQAAIDYRRQVREAYTSELSDAMLVLSKASQGTEMYRARLQIMMEHIMFDGFDIDDAINAALKEIAPAGCI